MANYGLPPHDLLRQQAAWLAPARSRLLRRVHIARRRRVLDLACGSGAATAELARRCGGTVVAVDRSAKALRSEREVFADAQPLLGDATRLPLADASFDLVFCQFALMWLDAAAVAREIHRVLRPDGMLAAIEPDYGGLIEHPSSLAARDLWLAALQRAGADPTVGRKLPEQLAAAGFQPHVELLDRLVPPSPARFELLRGLPQTPEEKARLREIEAADAACDESARVVHLPVFLISATK